MASRVLVVDDEPAIRHAVGRMLRREGWVVSTAGTAGEALAILEAEPTEAVLLDFHLPGMSGGQLGAEIVARWPNLSGRLLFVSGDPGVTLDTLPATCQGARLMSKPFDLFELAAVVRELLGDSDRGTLTSGTSA